MNNNMEETPKTISEAKAFSRMAHQCARKECCVFDIKTKLYRLNLDSEVIDRIIDELKKEKYIDEMRFTRSYINDKMRINKWGKAKIEFGLKQKRIPEHIVSEAFLDYSDDQLNDSLPDLLQAKWSSIKGNSEYEKQNKLIRFGLSRGFEMNKILKCLKNLK